MAAQEITITVRVPWYVRPVTSVAMAFFRVGAWLLARVGIGIHVGGLEQIKPPEGG